MKYFPRSLAAALQQLAADPKLRLSSQQENQIARSGYILVAVTSFLGDLRDQARLFTSLCLADQGDIARLRSHWSSSGITALLLVESFIVNI